MYYRYIYDIFYTRRIPMTLTDCQGHLSKQVFSSLIFTSKRYASAVMVCLFVCPSVCHKSEFTNTDKPRIAQTITLYDSRGKPDLGEIPLGTSPTGYQIAVD